MLNPEDYCLFPIVIGARWAKCRHCNMRDERIGIGDRLIQCPYCLNTRTSLDGKDLPPWLLEKVNEQCRSYAYDRTSDMWCNASCRIFANSDLEFFVWVRMDRLRCYDDDGFQGEGGGLPELFQELRRGPHQVYDQKGVAVALLEAGNLTYYDEAQTPA